MRLRDRAALLVCLFLLLPLPCALFGRNDLLQSHSNGVATGHLRNLGMVLRSINRKVFVARFSLDPFPKSIFKLDSHINYDGLPLMVDVPLVFLRVSQNLEYMRTARLSGTKAISSKVEDLSGPKWAFIGKMLPTDFHINARFRGGYSTNIHHGYPQEISVVQVKFLWHDFSGLSPLNNGSLKIGAILRGFRCRLSGFGSLSHLVQLSIINNADYDIQDEGSATNTDKPVFSSSNVLLKALPLLPVLLGDATGGSPSIQSSLFGRTCCVSASLPSSATVIAIGEPNRVMQLGLNLKF